MDTSAEMPSMDKWLAEAKKDAKAGQVGMYLVHNGVVRADAKAKVRQGANDCRDVTGMDFDYEQSKVDAAIENTYAMEGVKYVRVWLAKGHLEVGDSIMCVLVGADIRPHCIEALQSLVGTIKSECVKEVEQF